MTDLSALGRLPESDKSHSLAHGIQTPRGWTGYGLRKRVMGRWTYQVTAGTAGLPNTHNLTVGGASICGGAVTQAASNNATATAIATAVNAALNNYIATVSTDTVTIRQRKTAGAVTITKVVAGDAAGTLTAVTASTDTYTEHTSGATMDGDEYYELTWSGALCAEVDLTNARLVDMRLYVSGQAFQLWAGGTRSASNVILAGDPTAAATWTEALPWMDATFTWVIKLAADDTLQYHAVYI